MDFSKILNSLGENLLTPIPMCFALGIFCKIIRGGIKIPKELYLSIAIFLLMSIGFVGGHELAEEYRLHGLSTIWKPALATLFLGCLTPITSYVVLRYVGGMSIADSAGIAAHYGSTSAVTYAVATSFVWDTQHPADTFLPTLVTILECPGIAIALVLGAAFSARERAEKAASSTGKDLLPFLSEGFTAAAMAKVGTSALESRALGYLLESDVIVPHKDEVLHVALGEVRALYATGYRPPFFLA